MTKSRSLFVAFLLFLSIPQICNSQGNFLGTGVTVSVVVQDLQKSVESIIATLESSVGNTLFRSRQHMEIILDQVEAVSSGFTEKLFVELNNSEQEFFIDVQQQLEALKELEKITLQDVSKVSTNVSTGITNLPFAKKVPLVLDYSPLFVASGGEKNKEYIEINISGVLLASKEPFLIFNNSRCERSKKIDTSLAFLCNKNLFLAEETVETLIGRLHVYERVGFWGKILRLKSREYNYEIAINVIPLFLGKVTPSVTQNISNVNRHPRSKEFRFWNNHCAGSRVKLFEFNAAANRKIDPNSIEVEICRTSGSSRCNGLGSVSDRSFSYSCRIENRGICVRVLGEIVAKDARGSCGGTATWEELEENDALMDTTLETIELEWGKDMEIKLPIEVTSVRIVIDKIDGTRRIATDNGLRDPWLDVDVDLENRFLIVKPKSLEAAMNN